MSASKFLVFGKNSSFILIAFIMVILFFFTSCGNSPAKPLITTDNCITISRSQISTNMLSGGWSVPANNDFIPYIYFVPSSNSDNISVVAFPSDKENHLYKTRKVNLGISSVNPPCSLPAGLDADTSRYDFSMQNFADAKGKLIQFDFLRLVPRACTDPEYTNKIVFDVFMVTNTGGVETAIAKGYTKPCPPFCPIH